MSTDTVDVCLPNIGPAGIRQRRFAAAVQLAVGIVVAVAMLVAHAPWPYRAAVGVVFIAAAVSWFQTREKTCVALALAGVNDLDDAGAERVRDEAILKAQRRQAVRVVAKGVLLGLVPTALLVALP